MGLIETSEESGSRDLLPYIDALRPAWATWRWWCAWTRGAGNYDQLWLTTSLRGMASGTLKVEILTEGIHSGDASGLVPRRSASCARCWTGWKTAPPAACCPPASTAGPAERWPRRSATAAILGDDLLPALPVGALRLRRLHATVPRCPPPPTRCRPCSSAPGAHAQRDRRRGLPGAAGRRQRAAPYTAFKLSLRLPPLVDAAQAVQELKALLEDNAPYQAKVTFESAGGATGWNARPPRPGLSRRSTKPRRRTLARPAATSARAAPSR